MFTLRGVVAFIVLVWIFMYTASYGVWVWKKKNRLGAIAVFLIAAVALVFPVYYMLITR